MELPATFEGLVSSGVTYTSCCRTTQSDVMCTTNTTRRSDGVKPSVKNAELRRIQCVLPYDETMGSFTSVTLSPLVHAQCSVTFSTRFAKSTVSALSVGRLTAMKSERWLHSHTAVPLRWTVRQPVVLHTRFNSSLRVKTSAHDADLESSFPAGG